MKNRFGFLLFTALILCGSWGFAQKSDRDKKPVQNRAIPKEVQVKSWDPADIPDEKDEDEDRFEDDGFNAKDAKSGRDQMGVAGKAGQTRTAPNRKNPKSPNDRRIEQKAQEESQRLAQVFGVKNKNAQKKLLKACRKYMRALDHLERDYGLSGTAGNGRNKPSDGPQGSPAGRRGKYSEDYQKRKQELGLAYGQELRKILPES